MSRGAYRDEEVWSYRLLKGRGLLNPDDMAGLDLLSATFTKGYELVPCKRPREFFDSLAMKMRELWPAGEKDGKWPWRDSVKSLSMRLQVLWQDRKLQDYSEERCLTVARRYLARFEHDAKFMKTLKYYIMKQEGIVQPDGRIRYVNRSEFADMLESEPVSVEETATAADVSGGEGRLV